MGASELIDQLRGDLGLLNQRAGSHSQLPPGSAEAPHPSGNDQD